MNCHRSTIGRYPAGALPTWVQQVQQSGLVASVSGSTLWRWLHEDAIRPWYHRSWVFPLDLYARQARRREHATQNCRPRTPMHVEHEYIRCGAWTYIAALDVHHARIFGRCESKNGIAPFDRLVEQVMTRPPYNDARRVFWMPRSMPVGSTLVRTLRNSSGNLAPALTQKHVSKLLKWRTKQGQV